MTLIMLGFFSIGFLAGAKALPKVLGDRTSKQRVVERPPEQKDYPLRDYSIQNLQSRQFQVSEITIEKTLAQFPEYTSYLFSYRTVGKKMTGQMNVPTGLSTEYPVILLVRGYVEAVDYITGEGTRPAAAAFAKKGYVTFSPDFLGFGGSDPETAGWTARFEKPINVIELIHSLRQHSQLELPGKKADRKIQLNPAKLGIWAHSNGGQIALTTLEVLGEPIPTTLWAPVTAPFPYSVLYFSDEMEDEGKAMRGSVAALEREYNLQEFSLTQYLNRLRAPLQLHHGTADDAAPKSWSDDFVASLTTENKRRLLKKEAVVTELARVTQEEKKQAELAAAIESTESGTASESAIVPVSNANLEKTITTTIQAEDAFLQPIEVSYFVYPGANHAIRPGWDEAIERDMSFFQKHL